MIVHGENQLSMEKHFIGISKKIKCIQTYPKYVTLLIGYATGKQIQTSIWTTGANAAPIAKPYRVQTAWGRICI